MSLGAWLVLAVVVAWLLFTREGLVALLLLVSGLVLVPLFFG